MVFPATHPVLKRESEIQGSDPVIPEEHEGNVVEEQQEQMTFGDTEPAPPLQETTMADNSRFVRDDSTAHLGDYLSRPVLIDTLNWYTGATGAYINVFKPWARFFSDPHIQAKINNFARLQCDLKLKFLVNASPFYYGLLKVNYDPLNSFRNKYGTLATMSQTPGPYLAPQEMSSVEMTLPFLWPRDYLDICSASDFDAMGNLSYTVFAPLTSANGVTASTITVSCYAWAENVHLSAPTSISSLQAPGPISSFSQKVSKVARTLSVIPPISTMGTMVAKGADLVTDLATALGFSNSPNLADINGVQLKTFHAFANTEQKMPLDKLCLDPDNQLELDPRSAGLGSEDELAISNFVDHESFVFAKSWTTDDVSSAHVASFFVTPHIIQKLVRSSDENSYFPTPVGLASRFYKYWRGSMIYRIKVIASQYHKGRLQISWDPEDDASGTADTETTCFTKIVDLDGEKEIEILIPYKGVRAWSQTAYTVQSGLPIKLGAGLYEWTPDRTQHNGNVTIHVQNQLSAPVSPSTVTVMVFMRPGPDFELSQPVDNIRRYTVLPGDDYEIQGPDPIDGKAIVEDDVQKFTVGEKTISIRQLLHRTILYGAFPRVVSHGETAGLPATPTSKAVWMTQSAFPKLPQSYGYDDTLGMHYTRYLGTSTEAHGNFVLETPLDTFTNCFVGYRGSVNWHMNPLFTDVNDIPNMSIARYSGSTVLTEATGPTPDAAGVTRNLLQTWTQRRYASNAASDFVNNTVSLAGRVYNRDTGTIGTSVSNSRVVPQIGINLPQYSSLRFLPAFYTQRDKLPGNDNYYDGFKVSSVQHGTITDNRYYELYVSAGVDFNLFYFVCCPPMYEYAMPQWDEL
jgi:hypothetical protein